MVIIDDFDKVVQSMEKCKVVRNIFLLSLSRQTLQLLIECGVEIFHHDKKSDKKKIG